MLISDRKGQAAIEYLMVFGLALILSTPFIVRAQSSILELRTGSNAVELHNSLNKMESSIKTVNAAGQPARRTFTVKIPENVVESDSELDTSDNIITYTLQMSSGKSEISRTFDVDLTGDIPKNPGTHRVAVSATSNGVKIEVVS